MAKVKNKKRKASDRPKTAAKNKTLNPFEVHVNREKIKVLGRKSKNDRGLPGVSRAKALQKRKHTLQREYTHQNKANTFSDKRIGERNSKLSGEDKVMARFTALKVKANKKSIFNLADDEVLTHRGQTLSEIEKFDDAKADDDDDDDFDALDSKFVKEAHFGGGILTKTSSDGAKSHRDLIDQLISESKKRKAEKQKTKEQTLELTEKLDSEWKDLLPIVNKSNISKEDGLKEVTKADDYDKVMRELKFEARGTPSDRLKSEDEIAKEEKAKLEKMESERLDRMKGIVSNGQSYSKHRSADDLDDNFVYEPTSDVTLSYNDKGEANIKVDADINGRNIGEEQEEAESNSSDEDEDENEEEDQDESDANKSDNSGDESVDNLSDLKDDSSESDEEEVIAKPSSQQIKDDLSRRKATMEEARKELPYTFTLPDNYDELQRLLQNHTSSEQTVILERMIKCNHPGLAPDNKEKLKMLFVYLLQYVDDVANDTEAGHRAVRHCFELFGALIPQIFDLAQFDGENSQNSMAMLIEEKHKEHRKNRRSHPRLEIILFMKLVGCLFPMSDFRHRVVTPSFVFMDQILNGCRVRSKKDVAYGLFLTTLLLEFTELSKRYLPSSINFLAGLLHMAIPKVGVRLVRISPPFKSISNLLALHGDLSDTKLDLRLDVESLCSNDDVDDKFKIRAFYLTVRLLHEFFRCFEHLPSKYEIFQCCLVYMKMIPIENYPIEVREKFESLQNSIESAGEDRILKYLVVAKKKPKALRLYEPNIIKVFDGKRHKVQSKEKAERDKLLHKLKREKKGALREIRRDGSFLARLKINKQIQSDVERNQKVKRLFAEAAMQQSELNAIDRKKKRQ